ncbi:hypothetical protein [Humisphaera borealis]|uniref:Uncharacterized protein n=1 Tax=Humisphaera borealis TaxID=2807512 RepID=A0A7M2WWM9_9BACT|nr:hypothetical protein [Humisphaera borealis]QOV89241.1 hypothetical protein IPV69_24015 [Humisphaera borealis]
MRFRTLSRKSCIANPIETLEPRRLFSADVGRLASWAEPGVVDPNSFPPEEAIVVDEGSTGEEVFVDTDTVAWQQEVLLTPLPGYEIDPTVVLFFTNDAISDADPGAEDDATIVEEVPTEDEAIGDENIDDVWTDADGDYIDPAVCYFFPMADGAEIRTLEAGETDPVLVDPMPIDFDADADPAVVDPAVCYASGADDGLVYFGGSIDVGVETTAELEVDPALIDPAPIDPAVCYPVGIAVGEPMDLEVVDTSLGVPAEEVPATTDDEILYTLYTSDAGSPAEVPESPAAHSDALPFVAGAKAYDGIDDADDSLADLVFSDANDDALA